MRRLINLKNKVYDALNVYKQFGYKPDLLGQAYQAYLRYTASGGELSFEYFENTLDDYLITGNCGY